MPAARPAVAGTSSVRDCPEGRVAISRTAIRADHLFGATAGAVPYWQGGPDSPLGKQCRGPDSVGRGKRPLPPRWGQGGSWLSGRTRPARRFPRGKRACWWRELVKVELGPSRWRHPRWSRKAQRSIVLCHRCKSQAGYVIRPGRWSARYRHPLALRRPTTESE